MTVSRDGTTIAFDRIGDGAPIVLVGGATQHRAVDQNTARLARELASGGHTVVHYDRRGRGDSTDTAPYATEREVEDLAALVDEVGGEAAVFGMSSGGVIAIEAAVAGVPLTGLALYEPPLILRGDAMLPRDYVARLDALIAEDRRTEALRLFMVGAVGLDDAMFDGFRQTPIFPAFEAVAHTLAYDGRFIEQAVAGGRLPVERWSAVTAPVVVIDGGASPQYMRDAVQDVVDALPNARRLTIEGQTHAFEVDAVAPVLLDVFGG